MPPLYLARYLLRCAPQPGLVHHRHLACTPTAPRRAAPCPFRRGMPTTLTEVSVYSPSVVVPNPGEPVAAALGPGGCIRIGFQSLANRTLYLKDQQAAVAQFAAQRPIACRAYDYPALNSVLAFPQPFAMLDSATSDWAYVTPSGGFTIGGIGAWAATAWSYVYFVLTAGVLSFEISTTGPASSTAGPLVKSGDPTRRYLLSVYADGAGVPVPFQSRDGSYTYRHEDISTSLLTAGYNLAFTPASAAGTIPPHGQSLSVMLRLWSSDVIAVSSSVRAQGDPSVNGPSLWAGAKLGGNQDYVQAAFTVPMIGASQTIEWKNTGAAGFVNLSIFATGWEE